MLRLELRKAVLETAVIAISPHPFVSLLYQFVVLFPTLNYNSGMEIRPGRMRPDRRPAYESPASIGYRYFRDVSRETPNSYGAQAAGLALRCREFGMDPILLRNAVLGDPLVLRRISRVSQINHLNAGKGPLEVPIGLVEETVREDFSLARRLMDNLSIEDLKRIRGEIYDKAVELPDGVKRDDVIMPQVELMIEAARRAKEGKGLT